MNYIATRDGVELLDENADSIYMRYIATTTSRRKARRTRLVWSRGLPLIWKKTMQRA